jgi:hypothetical protein
VWKSIVGAVLGTNCGVALALLLCWAGPGLAEWLQGPPRLKIDAWVFSVGVICGAGFGALSGALIGAAAAITDAIRSNPRGTTR